MTNYAVIDALSLDDKKDLAAYAVANGRTWRSKLSADWSNGSEVLRSVRNAIGPSGLYAIQADDLRTWRQFFEYRNERKSLQVFKVRVFQDGSDNVNEYSVTAGSEIDARIIAFLLDGDLDTGEDIEADHVRLALTWTEVIDVSKAPRR